MRASEERLWATPSMSKSGRLFLSLNSRDREKVRVVAGRLRARGYDTFFDERSLHPGQSWPLALEHALTQASAVIAFVGPQLGPWQWNEVAFALDRQASDRAFPVIPVLLDDADTARSFLFLNTWVDFRGDRFDDPQSLDRLLDGLTAATSLSAGTSGVPLPDVNPFRGLEYFDEVHAPFFFGREAFVDDLFARVTQPKASLVAVIGASGSGKSSVVRAGLIPRLRRRRPPNATWDIAVMTPGDRPWFRIADALALLRFPDKTDTELDIEVDRMARALEQGDLRLDSVLDHILRQQDKRHRLLLVVDQFEELFTLAAGDARTRFVESLVQSLALPGVVLVPTLRADFYGQAIEANRVLSDLLGQHQITLGRLDRDELQRAIVEPARLARIDFDPGLPQLLLADAGQEPGSLPLLQHALLELYEGRAERKLTTAVYRKVGGIRGAIAHAAEREYRRFEREGQGPLVRRVFTQLVRLARADEGVEDTRRRVPTAALPPEAKDIVDEFAGFEYRLLVKSSERVALTAEAATADAPQPASTLREQQTVEVAHEALIREWGRLRAIGSTRTAASTSGASASTSRSPSSGSTVKTKAICCKGRC